MDGIHQIFLVGIAADEDDADGGVFLQNLPAQGNAVHLGNADIGQDDVHVLLSPGSAGLRMDWKRIRRLWMESFSQLIFFSIPFLVSSSSSMNSSFMAVLPWQ